MRRFIATLFLFGALSPAILRADQRPNIVFIISEDSGPELGCYGDAYATSPNIDRFAAESLRYTFCWSNAPVCAPARTTLISGMYPTSTGAEHMRSLVPLPEPFEILPTYLREAGYFTANLRKEDFNLEAKGQTWDLRFKDMTARPWRETPKGKPFFAIFNIPTSHESQIRERPHELVHDPAKAPLPAYHPDTPEVRRDWAQYYDKLTEMDREVGGILERIEEDGHADDTIVFYFGDHGSGMPRSKRWPYDSGLHVPLIIRIPDAFQELRPDDYEAGGTTDRLVSFVDFAPTVLSLAGIEPKEHFQGIPFLGKHARKPSYSPYVLHGFRGRMDERIDLVRSVTDGRYVYIRNYMPHRIYGQHIGYMFQTPTTRVWKDLYDDGKLNNAQSAFWEQKPSEELYDLESDPDEINNLADSPEHPGILAKLRGAQVRQVLDVWDVGFLPEAMLHEICEEHGITPAELFDRNDLYPLESILPMAEIASRRETDSVDGIVAEVSNTNPAIRYWALMGLLIREEHGFEAAGAEMIAAKLRDSSASVRIVAAELGGRYGDDDLAKRAMEQLLEDANYRNTGEYAATSALLVVDELLTARPEVVTPRIDAIKELPLPVGNKQNLRAKEYPSRLKARLLERTSGM